MIICYCDNKKTKTLFLTEAFFRQCQWHKIITSVIRGNKIIKTLCVNVPFFMAFQASSHWKVYYDNLKNMTVNIIPYILSHFLCVLTWH